MISGGSPPASNCTSPSLAVADVAVSACQVELFTEGDEVNELMFVVAGYLEVFASSAAAEEKDRESM